MSDVDVPQASSEDPVPATPPPGPAPGGEDLLGLRIAAALIDIGPRYPNATGFRVNGCAWRGWALVTLGDSQA